MRLFKWIISQNRFFKLVTVLFAISLISTTQIILIGSKEPNYFRLFILHFVSWSSWILPFYAVFIFYKKHPLSWNVSQHVFLAYCLGLFLFPLMVNTLSFIVVLLFENVSVTNVNFLNHYLSFLSSGFLLSVIMYSFFLGCLITYDIIALQKSKDVSYINNEQITVKSFGELHRLKLADIILIEAKDYYISIKTHSNSYLVRMSLHHIEKKLPESLFKRSHRSYIVCLNQIRKVKKNQNITLKNGDQVPLSRKYSNQLIEKLSITA